MENRIDLHIHTTASDGTDTPAEVVGKAFALGLSAVAVTDHDTVAGLAEAMREGRRLGIEVVAGIEISADYHGGRAHILGYFIDPGADALQPVLAWSVNERERRNRRIVQAMAADGIDISVEQLAADNPGSVIGRPHIADRLVQLGYAASVKEAFERYLNDGCRYYRDKKRISIEGAVDAITGAGGIAIVAHPFQYGYDEMGVLCYIDTCLQAGCAGVEAYYSEHTADERRWLLDLAAGRGIAVSGGSDYHGGHKPHIAMGSGIDGGLFVPLSVLDGLKLARGG